MKHKKHLDKKWKVLEKRGLKRPSSPAEAKKRLQEAHHAH